MDVPEESNVCCGSVEGLILGSFPGDTEDLGYGINVCHGISEESIVQRSR